MTRTNNTGRDIEIEVKRQRKSDILLNACHVHRLEHFPCIILFNPQNKLLLLPYYIVVHTANEEQSLKSSYSNERIGVVGGRGEKSGEGPVHEEVPGQPGQ